MGHRNSVFKTEEKWRKECRRLCALAKRILEGDGEFLDNSQKMAAFRFWMGEQDNQDFNVFETLVAASSHLPVGEARQRWATDALALKDTEIRQLEETYRKEVHESAARIHNKYAQLAEK